MQRANKIAKEKHLEYSKYEGSQHIATEHAIKRILELVIINNSKTILELGIGIGTIYSSVIKCDDSVDYYGTENNTFCLVQLEKNLKDSYNNLKLFSNLDAIVGLNKKFDMVIIDGKDESIEKLPQIVSKNAVIVVEGDRSEQETKIKLLFKNAVSNHVITNVKNDKESVFTSRHYQGGVKVIFVNPTIRQKAYWLKHKILTKIKYKFRNYNQ